MELFHFICEKHGLDDIRNRRLKISEIQDLNDPFELIPFKLSNKDLRDALHKTKEQISSNRGILCFSKTWSNPVLWSHYADKHRGLCLGFNVPSNGPGNIPMDVEYTAERLDSKILRPPLNETVVKRLLSTKFAHWEYENEARVFVNLDKKDPKTNLYFTYFSDSLKLVQVIVGARSELSRKDLTSALGDMATEIKVIQAGPSFTEFEIVQNPNESLWA